MSRLMVSASGAWSGEIGCQRSEKLVHRELERMRVARDPSRGEDRLGDAVEKVDPRVAMRVPRRHIGEAEPERHAVANRRSLRAQVLERADGAAELHGEALRLRLREALAIAGERRR